MSVSMRFVTDLSKGILGESDSSNIWQEVIAHIPDEVLIRPDVRILNVSFGHGTEADIIARRMLALGVPSHKVNSSIYLLDKYRVFTNRAVRKGYANVVTADFLEWNPNMKFDVVVGNPPYQNGKDTNFYAKFMQKAEVLSKQIVIMITPNFASSSNKNKLPKNLVLYKDLADTAFDIQLPSGTCYYMQDFSDTSENVKFIDYQGKEVTSKLDEFMLVKDSFVIDILKKIKTKKSLASIYYHGSTPKVNTAGNFQYIDKVGNNSTDVTIIHSDVQPSERVFKKWKVVVSYNAPGAKFDSKKIGTTKIFGPDYGVTASVVCFIVDSEEEAVRLKAYLDSNLVKFIIRCCKYATNNSKSQFELLPMIPLNKDIDLYQHFNLTQEEIDYVETNAI